MKPANYGPLYAAGLYPKLAEVFRSHGYALAVHGSVARDFDLIAVPWVDSAGDPQAVIAEVLEKFAVKYAGCEVPDARPHRRLAYKLALSFADHALDISFTPRAAPETSVTPELSMPPEPDPDPTKLEYDDWISRTRECPACHGKGCEPHETDEGRLVEGPACGRCDGAGRVPRNGQ